MEIVRLNLQISYYTVQGPKEGKDKKKGKQKRITSKIIMNGNLT